MAEWQVVFHIVPSSALAAAPQPFTPAILDHTDWWASAAFPGDYRTQLATVASAPRTWQSGFERWGPEAQNHVDVWSVGGRVRRVVAQVDVRRLDSRFGAALLGFVRRVDAVLIRADGMVVATTIGAFAAALRSSSAWRHASDPATFLSRRAAIEGEEI